jgi:hypothetical protein
MSDDEIESLAERLQPWINLAMAIKARRGALGLTQEQVTALGGPSTATLRLLEGAIQAGGYRDSTLNALDRALGWISGSHRQLMEGKEPYEAYGTVEECRRMLAFRIRGLEGLGAAYEDRGRDRKEHYAAERPVGLGLDAAAAELTPEQIETVRAVIRAMKPPSETE